MNFLNPFFFWLLLIVPLIIVFYFYTNKIKYSRIPFSLLYNDLSSLKSYFFISLFILRLIAIVLIIIALARPQTQSVSEDSLKREGIDIMIAMDVSSSMLAEDFKPNRLIGFVRSDKSYHSIPPRVLPSGITRDCFQINLWNLRSREK